MGVYAGFCLLVFAGTGALFGASWVLAKLRHAMKKVDDAIADADGEPTDRHAWDPHCEDAVLLTHEKRDEEETNDTAADFLLWADELDVPQIRKHMRRMEKWSQ